MSHPLKVVAVSGGLNHPSRTRALVDHLLASLSDAVALQATVVDLADIGPQFAGTVARAGLTPAVEAAITAIESADLLVVASPVYRATYSGLFKHLFDLVHHEALVGVPVLLAATGGSDRHALVIDHQLRPLFSFFQANTLPVGVYAVEQDFDNYRVTSPALLNRIALAVERALPQLQHRPASAEHAVPAA